MSRLITDKDFADNIKRSYEDSFRVKYPGRDVVFPPEFERDTENRVREIQGAIEGAVHNGHYALELSEFAASEREAGRNANLDDLPSGMHAYLMKKAAINEMVDRKYSDWVNLKGRDREEAKQKIRMQAERDMFTALVRMPAYL